MVRQRGNKQRGGKVAGYGGVAAWRRVAGCSAHGVVERGAVLLETEATEQGVDPSHAHLGGGRGGGGGVRVQGWGWVQGWGMGSGLGHGLGSG